MCLIINQIKSIRFGFVVVVVTGFFVGHGGLIVTMIGGDTVGGQGGVGVVVRTVTTVVSGVGSEVVAAAVVGCVGGVVSGCGSSVVVVSSVEMVVAACVEAVVSTVSG